MALAYLRSEDYDHQYPILDMNNDGTLLRIFQDSIVAGAQMVRDIWGHVVSNPRDQNLDKEKMYELEKQLLGLDKTTTLNPVNKAAWKTPQPPPCPVCKEKVCLTWLAADEVRCGQCGHQFPPSGQWQEVTVATRNGLAKVRTRTY